MKGVHRRVGQATSQLLQESVTLRILFILITLTSLLHAQSGPTKAADVQDAFKRGALAMQRGDTAAAESAFRQAILIAPDLADAHLDLGLVLGRQGRQEEALTPLRKAVELDPKLPSAHMFLGIFLYQANHVDEAILELQNELALGPPNAETLTWLGIIQLSNGHPEQAVAPLDQAFALAPDDLNILEYRAKAHMQTGRNTYARMAEIAPNSWQVHKVSGELYSEDGKRTEAIHEFESAIAAQPLNPELYEALGDEYRHGNELAEAAKAYRSELALVPHDPIALYNLGSTQIELGDYGAGVKLLSQVHGQYAQTPVLLYYLGRGLAGMGRDAEAVLALENSAEGSPTGELGRRSFYELARVYRRMQQPAKASESLMAYNRLRQAEEQRSAQKIEDWRKINKEGARPK